MKLQHYDVCGYPLFYVHPYGHGAYCASCMTQDLQDDFVNPDEVTAVVNWEDPELYCAWCSQRIEAAYEEIDFE